MLYVEAEKGGGEFNSETDVIVENSASGGESSDLGGDSEIASVPEFQGDENVELGGRGKRGIVENSSGGESYELGGESEIPSVSASRGDENLELGGRGKRVREKELEPVE